MPPPAIAVVLHATPIPTKGFGGDAGVKRRGTAKPVADAGNVIGDGLATAPPVKNWAGESKRATLTKPQRQYTETCLLGLLNNVNGAGVQLDAAYEVGATLGEGGFGTVAKGTNRRTGEVVAVKTISWPSLASPAEMNLFPATLLLIWSLLGIKNTFLTVTRFNPL